MDTIHSQISLLNQKMDRVFQAIEELSRQLAESLGELRVATPAMPATANLVGGNGHHPNYSHHHVIEDYSEHRDVLIDSNGMETFVQGSDRVLPPDLQIQRLTAQLTAAYNRIAALEEQLLARRLVS
ncbi:MAG: hypothetical protein VKJ24_07610 [Synechococcales bacterium]|nr:hypothetical protein [Synechococcales bacterium]